MIKIEEYLKKRLGEIGLTEKTNKRTISFEGKPQKIPVIWYDEKSDALSIPYCEPGGECSMCQNGKKYVPFERLRYRIARTYKNKEGKEIQQRYNQPAKSGVYTYMTPGIVDKYLKSEKIKTLYVVEGEFKALSGDIKLKLPFVGIGGIQNIKESETNEIDVYIRSVIERCNPDNVVLLFDADCLSIKYKENEDLSSRLNNFYTAIMSFRQMLKSYEIDIYFAHISTKFAETAKGLDDLLFTLKKDQIEKIKSEFEMLTAGKKDFIEIKSLDAGCDKKLSQYFNLSSVSEFYQSYKTIIQDREFKYKGKNYYFDGEKVILTYYNLAKQYIRIGCDFYKKTWKINHHKEAIHQVPVLILRPWSIGEINRDFADDKKFIAAIPRFDQFVNVPCNTKDYKRFFEFTNEGISTTSYNRYNMITHEIDPGEWPLIEKFLKHIFAAKNTANESLYEFGLDYLQLCFFTPCQKLPVICLVSKERNTGKSTFLQFLRLIFQENTSILDNERFTGKFTSHFVDKLIVAVDEGFIPIEQKLMKERIKNYSTGQTQWLEGKGKDANEIDNFMHLVLCSNDENNFMQIDQGENRFAVIKVNPLTDTDNPNLLDDMRKEVGHFLYFLSKRTLYYPINVSRFSFPTQVYETEILKKVQERTMNKMHKEIRQYITDCFEKFGIDKIKFAPVDLAREINNEGSFRISKSDVVDYLKYELQMTPEPFGRYELWRLDQDTVTGNYIPVMYGSKPGTPYQFLREDFIKE